MGSSSASAPTNQNNSANSNSTATAMTGVTASTTAGSGAAAIVPPVSGSSVVPPKTMPSQKSATGAAATAANRHSAIMTPIAVPASSDAERRELRPTALSIVSDAWRAGATPADFVSAVRARLPTRSATAGMAQFGTSVIIDDSGISRSASAGAGGSGIGGGSQTPSSRSRSGLGPSPAMNGTRPGSNQVTGTTAAGTETVNGSMLNNSQAAAPNGDAATEDVLMSEDVWLLPPASEGAILDALFSKIVNSEAASTRLLDYLSYTLVTGIVSQRAMIATCLQWIETTPSISEQVLQAFTKLITRILPHYRFTNLAHPQINTEIQQFLAIFIVVVKCTANNPLLAPSLVTVLVQERVVALVRACARRVPSVWMRLHNALDQLDVAPPSANSTVAAALPVQSALSVAPYLKPLVARLKQGLAFGITTFESIAASIGSIAIPTAQDPSISKSLQSTFTLTIQFFGNEVASALGDLLSKQEGNYGDFQALVDLERAASKRAGLIGGGGVGSYSHGHHHHSSSSSSSSSSASSSSKHVFRNNVQACEAIVRFVSERFSAPGAMENWSALWGGRDRLKRTIVNALPQVKNEITSETGALVVAMAIVCCAAMCLGPSLRIRDPNDGVEPRSPAEMLTLQQHNEQVEDTIGELTSFAVFILEEAAVAEEVPLWRSFGLWLLLLMSRAGSMLRACGCDHVRAARVLHAWGGVPTGTPGSHASHGSSSNAHKHSTAAAAAAGGPGGTGGSGHHGHSHQPSSSSAAAALSEGVSMFATSASLAIIDVSDVSGSNETIQALCDDLVQ